MKILNRLLGYNKHKAQDNSFPQNGYKDRPYYVSRHAAEQMNNRKINKGEVHTNLHTPPIHKTKTTIGADGRPSYNRSSENKITTSINPKTKTVVTVHRLHSKDYAKYKIKGGNFMILSEKSMDFLIKEIFPKMRIANITEDNARLIVDYIVDNFEVPLAQADEAGEIVDKELLEAASNAVTEITKMW